MTRLALVLVVACGSSDARGPTTFERDYGKPGTWRYGFHQQLTVTAALDPDQPAQQNHIQSDGTIVLVSNQDKSATATVEAKLTTKQPGRPDSTEPAPTQTLKLYEDGHADDKQDTAIAMTSLLFPVPTKPMKVGDTQDVPIAIPAEALPGGVKPSGMTMKLVGFTSISGIACARFESTIRTVDKEFHFNVDGKYCLDLDDASVRTAHVTMDVAFGAPDGSRITMAGTSSLDR